MARADRTQSGVLRFNAYRCMGVREYLYGTSLGHGMGEERSAAYKHGDRVVVRRTTGDMAQQEERRAA